MTAILMILSIILLLFLAFLLAVKGQKSKEMTYFNSFKYSHRGLYNNKDIPENSMLAFSKAVESGYGIELDVHLLKDGTLVVFHDATLLRMAGEDTVIETLAKSELKKYRLIGTTEFIPHFSEVLQMVDGKVPLLIELKSNKNVDKLCSAVNSILNNYNGKYTVQSFDPRCLRWFKKHSPQKVRGQIAQNSLKDKKIKYPVILKLVTTLLLFNFLTKPNYVSYRFEDRKILSFKISKKLWGIDGFVWTIRNKEDKTKAEKENLSIIFENFNA